MKLKPLGKTILFRFLDETRGKQGVFSERTRSGLIVPTLKKAQHDERWAVVVSVGPEVATLKDGDYILIEALGWMVGANIDTGDDGVNSRRVWKTLPEKIMAVSNDINATVKY